MNDDLERQLDEFYRKLDGSARRVEARWKSTPESESRSIAAWLGAAVAAAAAILLILSALRSAPKPPDEPVVKTVLPVEPPPRTDPEPPSPPPVRPKPALPETPRTNDTPVPPEPRPLPVPPEQPKSPTPIPPTTPRPEPPKRPELAPTQVTRATVKLQTEGTFDLADKGVRGKQKDLEVAPGDRLRASTTVKITLANDRFLLLAPRTVVEFRPEEKRLSLSLEQGELLAELIGPGSDVRVVTKACDITPLGTVFGVKVDPGRVMVTVEKGRVDVQSPKGKATLRAAEALQALGDGSLGTPAPADFRALAWARKDRMAEMTPYSEDFSKPGTWFGEIDKGIARAMPKQGCGLVLNVSSDKPPLFEVPVRGSITVVCRTDRANKFKIQLFSPEHRTNYTKSNIQIIRGEAWRTVTLDFEEFVPADKSKPARLLPGSPVTDLLIMYAEEGEPGNFWIDSIKVLEVRP